MKNWLTIVALAGGLLACSDEPSAQLDESIDSEPLAQITTTEDAGVPKLQVSGGSAKITNTGATCAANTDCKGSDARCLTAIPLINMPVVGGHCTASCRRDTECGTTGGCPLAQIADLAKTFLPDAGALADSFSMCLQKCTRDSDCRAGLPCQTLPIPSIPFVLRAPTSKFCLPPLPQLTDGGIRLPDGGILTARDGGFRLPDGGIPGLPSFPAPR